MSAQDDVAQHIASQVGTLTYGVDCLVGPIRRVSDNQSIPGAVPGRCVFCNATGGFPSVAYKDGGVGAIEFRPSVLIVVRSENNDFTGGYALAEEVFTSVNKNPPSGYAESSAVNSTPAYIRKDEREHHEWSININLISC